MIRISDGVATDIDQLNINFTLSPHIFTGIGENFPKLKSLCIIDQSIEVIEREDFLGLVNLEGLFLNGNKINFLPGDVLYDLQNLRYFDISRNLIKRFHPNIFKMLTNIEGIGAYGNPGKMNEIDFSTINVKFFNETVKYYYKAGGKYSYNGRRIK